MSKNSDAPPLHRKHKMDQPITLAERSFFTSDGTNEAAVAKIDTYEY
jgi:hypothetical protein